MIIDLCLSYYSVTWSIILKEMEFAWELFSLKTKMLLLNFIQHRTKRVSKRKSRKNYIFPQIVFLTVTGMQRSINTGFQKHQLQPIIDSSVRIKNEYDNYFDEVWGYETFSSFS